MACAIRFFQKLGNRLVHKSRLRGRRQNRSHYKPRGFVFESLEPRLLLSVDFFAAAPAVPLINHADVPLGNLNAFEEPNLTINNRADAGNILITSHNDTAASTNMFVTDSNGLFPVANFGDTWADFDTTGRAWWTNLDATTADTSVRVVQVNPTTGAPIGTGTVVNTPPAGQDDDRQALAVDSFPNSPWHDNIYVIWTRFGIPAPSRGTEVFVAVSSNQGATWTTTQIGDSNGPDNIPNNADDENFGQQVHIAVDNNGDVWAAYHAQPGLGATGFIPDGTSGHVRLFRSTDGGITWNASASLPFTNSQADITFNRQEAAALPTSIPGTDFLTQGSVQPYVLPDPARDNQVYVIAADDTDNNHGAGDDSDLYIARSNNNGATWTRTLLPHGGGTNFQLFPTAAIDQFGDMVVTWYDNRRGLTNDGPDNIAGNADDNFLLDWMGMYSVDGGVSWSAPFRINDATFDPDETPITFFGTPPGPTTRIGEYFGLDLFGGTAYVAFNGNTPGDNTTSQQVFFDAFAINGLLVVSGDDNGPADDVFIIRRLAADSDYVEVSVNSVRQYVGLFEALPQVTFNGLDGNDSLTVDSTNGLLSLPNGIRYDGGPGRDGLSLLQSGGPTHSSDTYSVGPAIGSGISTIVGAGTADTQTVFFEALSPVLDLVPAATLMVNATPADNAVSYTVGSAAINGLVTIDEQESIEFSNKTVLTLNAGAGTDTISLNNPNTPTELTDITVNGGDPMSGDTLIVTGVEGAVTVATGPQTIRGATGAGGAVEISYPDIEALNLPAGIGDLTVTTTDADENLTVTPGVTPAGGNSGRLQANGVAPEINFANSGTVTANLAGGRDAVVVNGSVAADMVAVSGTAVTIRGRHPVHFTGVQALTVNGLAGSDTFEVTPSRTVAMFIDGGDPVGATPGDRLNIVAGDSPVIRNPGPEPDEGSFIVGRNQPVSFDHIESVAVADPNDQIAEAVQTAVGSTVSGTISSSNDVDMAKFTVRRGQRVGFDVDRTAGSNLDSFIRLFNASGVQLASNNNGAAPGEGSSTSAYLEFTFSTAGTFYLGVSANPNRTYNPLTGVGDVAGGSTGRYRLTLTDLTRRTVSAAVDSEELAG